MKLLLLCLGLTLFCTHGEGSAVVRSNFDLEKISGKWYSVLLASDKKEKIEEDGSMRVFVEFIYALKNSSIFFKFHIHVNGECTELPLVADKKGDGVYAVDYAFEFVLWDKTGKGFLLLPMDKRSSELNSVCSTDDGHNKFHIVETDYDNYIIFHLKNVNSGETFQLLELYGRKPDVGPELKEKFREFSQENGVVPENILDLTSVDRCLQARDEK
ncbi:Salivary lipocalin [Heterocephalus glaber]|uniref:Salivary lipocalin n=1 Tax=Heterocephalus glaber TaxID=10181 RepID=G5BWR1_HETGA|nr:Salivary lipocalin [Heterocephalus glaber]